MGSGHFVFFFKVHINTVVCCYLFGEVIVPWASAGPHTVYIQVSDGNGLVRLFGTFTSSVAWFRSLYGLFVS